MPEPPTGKPTQGRPRTATTGTVERGQYLVDHVLVCGVCHTPNGADGKPDLTKYLAGSRSYDFADKDGTIVTVNAENLTSHNPEGLATWSDEQIRTALTKGIDDEKVPLYPIMPYPEYSLLTRVDVDFHQFSNLRTIPPNDNVVPADYPYFDQNPAAPSVDEAKIPHTTLPSSDPGFAAAERGRYPRERGLSELPHRAALGGRAGPDEGVRGGQDVHVRSRRTRQHVRQHHAARHRDR